MPGDKQNLPLLCTHPLFSWLLPGNQTPGPLPPPASVSASRLLWPQCSLHQALPRSWAGAAGGGRSLPTNSRDPSPQEWFGFCLGKRERMPQRTGDVAALARSAHLWNGQPPGPQPGAQPCPHTPCQASLPPRANTRSLLPSDSIFFFLKVNGQHILAKRNSAFWTVPATYTDYQGIFS